MPVEEYNLLIVDDEKEILDLIKATFADLGLRVLTADSVSKAQQLVNDYHFEVVLSDQHLPDGNGIDFLAKLPSLGIDSVPILMTGYLELSVATGAINKGKVYKLVHKPLDLILLRETIQSAREHYTIHMKRKLFTREVIETNVKLKREAADKEASLRDAIAKIRFGKETVARQQVEIDTLYTEIQEAYLQTVTSLTTAIEAKDRYTRGHSERVYFYCSLMAEAMGIPETNRMDLRFASLLHDLGKIGIPDSILTKSGNLTDEEYRIIESHPEMSENILKPLPFLENIRKIIRNHHERYDGKGYPDGLKGEEISLEGRILSVADAYDAMRSDRPYRRALSQNASLDQIQVGGGSQFCPICVEYFITAIEYTGEFRGNTSSWRDEKWVTAFMKSGKTSRIAPKAFLSN